VIVANTHLTFPHGSFDAHLRLRQIRWLLDDIDAFAAQCVHRRTSMIWSNARVNGSVHDRSALGAGALGIT